MKLVQKLHVDLMVSYGTSSEVNDRYHPSGILITENGCSDPGNTEYVSWPKAVFSSPPVGWVIFGG